jgi:ribose 5-phosphate isomerase B
MKIAIGSDHAGFEYKEYIKAYLINQEYEVYDHGTYNLDSVDYPDFVHPVGNDLDEGRVDYGIVICGSGNGAAMAANKHKSVRCALCWTEELAVLARAHNDANAISIPARFVSKDLAIQMIALFLKSPFEGGRHQRRVDKIACA